MRTLYAPIIEPGENHNVALVNKRGYRDALARYGDVEQIDYLAIPIDKLHKTFMERLSAFKPDLLFTQLHGADRLTPDDFRIFRGEFPKLIFVNWSGDSWNHSLVSPVMLDLCRQFDLQMVAAPDVLPIYAQHGIRAKFQQIAYESPVGLLPDMPAYDVVMLGNVISEKRRKLFEFLRTLKDVKVGIYGDWEHADGRCTYNFGMGEALYKNAKVAIADAAYVDQKNYVSNRPIQVLMAGGAILLHEHVSRMDVLLGIEDGENYLAWDDFYDLERSIKIVLNDHDPAYFMPGIVSRGQTFARVYHTYDVRATQLFDEFLPELVKV